MFSWLKKTILPNEYYQLLALEWDYSPSKGFTSKVGEYKLILEWVRRDPGPGKDLLIMFRDRGNWEPFDFPNWAAHLLHDSLMARHLQESEFNRKHRLSSFKRVLGGE